jgi:ubiquinone/menaquinone biosynthesis C-methylase UbiE
MSDTIYSRSHALAEADSSDQQERNRAWWSRLPMTYENWDHADRSTSRRRVVEMFLTSNPWLTADYFSRFAGKDVLEVGCGAGPATYLFAAGGANCTAIDLTDQAVTMTKAHTEGLNVLALQMDAERMTFPDASFDHVFSWGVVHHSEHTEAALREICRVLRPDGTALVMVYNRASLRYWVKGALWLVLKRRLFNGDDFNSVQRFFTDGYFHRHFTPNEFRNCLRPMTVERLSVTHMSNKMLPLVPRWFDEWCKRYWGWLLVAEARKPT